MRDIPLAILSFNRPHYLSQVLDSLAAQTALNGRRVHLFQDNAISPITKIRYARDEDIAACTDLFRARFPGGVVKLAPHNLGIARNFLRAEEFVFGDLDSEVAYFFEDDMVLSPHYLAMMDRIYSDVRTQDAVGYFAAYGKLATPLAVQRTQAHRTTRLAWHWGFGLTRSHWRQLRAWLEPYYQIGAEHDYTRLPKGKLVDHYHALGIPLGSVCQDVMKRIGTYAVGRVGINTRACFARYIGVEGVHSTREVYEQRGYTGTEIYPETVDLMFPGMEELARHWEAEVSHRLARWNERSPNSMLRSGFVRPPWASAPHRSAFGRHSSRAKRAVIRRLARLWRGTRLPAPARAEP